MEGVRSEAQARLLHAVAERVGAAAVVEVHLFAPIRQGGVESGIAVVAVDESVAAVSIAAESVAAESVETESVETESAPADGVEAAGAVESAVTTLGGPPPEIQDGAESADERHPSVAERGESLPDGRCDPTDAAAGAAPAPPAAPARRLYPADAAAYRPARYAVYTARYRMTLKGPDRGKWEVDVRAEADAPLLTVDAVVRGVQRRAPDAVDSERLDGEQFRALLVPEPEWSQATSRRRNTPR